jgi:tetratricopeptide (TPR) repeat protein
MPPEQLEGTTDERSEVFGLGAILYEILTGQAPYTSLEGKEPIEAVKARVREARLERPRRLVGSVPHALERICLKALARDPQERYASAAALGEDVQHYLADEPVSAGGEPWGTRARRWCRRHRTAVTSVAVALLVALVLGVGGWWWLEQDQAARRQETASGVNRALGKVEQLREQVGRIRPGDPSRAGEALSLWEQALAAVEQAQGVLQAGLADEELQQRVNDLHQEVQTALQQQRKEVKLLAALDHAHGLATLTHDGQWAHQAAAEAYARAIVEYSGLDVRTASAQTLVDWLQHCPAELLEPLRGAMETWAVSAGQEEDKRRLTEVVERVVSDPWLRRCWAAVKEPGTVRLRQLAEEAQGKRLPASALLYLGIALSAKGDKASALALLRSAQASYPDDFWVNFQLGYALSYLWGRQPEALEEALGFFRAALALRPRSAPVHTNVGLALAIKKDLAGAIAAFHKALELDPKFVPAHGNLGLALMARQDLTGAIACYKKALELDPKYVPAHNGLGVALAAKQDRAGAIAAFQKALQLDPKYVPAHVNLGLALAARQDLTGAIACYHKALELDPKFVEAHYNLGVALHARKDLAGAIVCFQKALVLDPNHAPALNGLGVALAAKQDRSGAIAAFQKALELNPKLVEVYNNLGNALREKTDLAGAIACFQKALELDPNFTLAHYNLGLVLRYRGEFAKSLVAFRSYRKLVAGQAKGKEQLAAFEVRVAEQVLELEGKLPRLLQGAEHPSDAKQALLLHHLCCWKGRYAAAARFARDAFAAQPQFADDLQAHHRYHAACSATLAGCGQSKDVPTDAGERAALRRQALQWLRADLALWSKHLAGGTAENRLQVQQALDHWRSSPYLAGVRDARALAALPEVEQQTWRQLWADVAALRKQAQEKK